MGICIDMLYSEAEVMDEYCYTFLAAAFEFYAKYFKQMDSAYYLSRLEWVNAQVKNTIRDALDCLSALKQD